MNANTTIKKERHTNQSAGVRFSFLSCFIRKYFCFSTSFFFALLIIFAVCFTLTEETLTERKKNRTETTQNWATTLLCLHTKCAHRWNKTNGHSAFAIQKLRNQSTANLRWVRKRQRRARRVEDREKEIIVQFFGQPKMFISIEAILTIWPICCHRKAHTPTAQAKIQIHGIQRIKHFFFSIFFNFSLSNDRTAERKKNSNTQQQQNCRKERKTRTHQRHWLSTQRYNSIIIAFRVRLLHDLCLSLSSHMETNQATECNIHSDTNTHTKYTSKIARLQVIEEMCDCSFANAHAHTKWWWHAVKPKTESGDT